MRNWVAVLTFGSLAAGCIVYDEKLVEDGNVNRPLGEEDQTEEANFTVWLDPAGGIPGDIAILSLRGEGDVDLTTVESVQFFGGATVDVLATDIRDANEFLLTIDIADDAALGADDLLVQFGNGAAAYVEAAFEVVADPSQIPESDHGSEDTTQNGNDGC